MKLTDLPQLASLSTAEKLQLVDDLWDEIAADPHAVPFPEWQKQELARRRSAFEANAALGGAGTR